MGARVGHYPLRDVVDMMWGGLAPPSELKDRHPMEAMPVPELDRLIPRHPEVLGYHDYERKLDELFVGDKDD